MTDSLNDILEYAKSYLAEWSGSIKNTRITVNDAIDALARWSREISYINEALYINLIIDPTKETPLTEEEWDEIVTKLKEKA